jgi:ribosomal protein S3AE
MVKILKKKFFEVDIPMIAEKYESYAGNVAELEGKTIKMDMTRKLRGKSLDMSFRIILENGKPVAQAKKLVLMPFFIKHMLHTGIDYVEDSISTETKDSKVVIKPFFITRKKVSRAVRRTLRNSAKNWLEDYLKTKTDDEIFNEILSNQLQKPLGLKLKKIYPLAICEIRVFEVIKSLGKKAEEKIVGNVEIKKEIIESAKGDVQEVKEEIIENLEAKPEKKPRKSSKKTDAEEKK